MATMFETDAANVFAIPDFWKPSSWLDEPLLHSAGQTNFFKLDLNAGNEPPVSVNQETPSLPKDGFFRAPSFSGLGEIEQPALSEIQDLKPMSAPLPEAGLDDELWLPQAKRRKPSPQYRDWASFDSGQQQDSSPCFITEAGPEAFDAFLDLSDNGKVKSLNCRSEVLVAGPYCASLLALALGRASVLFAWDFQKKTFRSTGSPTRITGFSTECLEGVVQTCLECGTSTRLLKLFVERTYASHAKPSAISLANVTQHILTIIQRELGSRGQNVQSLLQLQALVRPVHSVVRYFRDLVAKLSKAHSDEHMLSFLYAEVQAAEYGEVFVRDIMREVLRHMSKPWLDFVAQWIGLDRETGLRITKAGPGKSFIKVDNRIWVDDMGFELEEPDYFLEHGNVPAFIPEEMAQSFFEAGRNLRFIRENHPEHPFSDSDILTGTGRLTLKWEYDWDSIQRLERRAAEFEMMVTLTLNEMNSDQPTNTFQRSALYSAPPTDNFHFFGLDEIQSEQRLLASMATLDQPIARPPEDGLTAIISSTVFSPTPPNTLDSSFSPHFTLLPLLSFGPIISAQARLINRESTRLLFTAHSLREHLSLQHSFHLLGNGLFCSRLSHALFDPALDTAERRAGVALTGGTMGLRLTGRDTWPPASSELRLALMGVLSESYQHGRPPSTNDSLAVSRAEDKLPGDLSFAVRDLAPEEMLACMDPHSLSALDFLRLSYKPPPALRSILTPVALARYDRIFRLLLRVQRVLYVVDQLFSETRGVRAHFHDRAEEVAAQGDVVRMRFRVEAHQFVSAVAAYFFDTGITLPWGKFEKWLDGVQKDLEGPRVDGRGEWSPEDVRVRQDGVLDEIMAVLLLRKKQAPVLRLLEDIFGVVLEFARVSGAGQVDVAAEMGRLYATFRKQVGVFITVCWGMSEKVGTKGGDGEEDPITRLLLLLDMTGYYRKPSP